jgi:hypothetical protein
MQIRNKYRQELKNGCPSQKAWGDGGRGAGPFPLFPKFNLVENFGVGGHSFHQLTLHINSVNKEDRNYKPQPKFEKSLIDGITRKL